MGGPIDMAHHNQKSAAAARRRMLRILYTPVPLALRAEPWGRAAARRYLDAEDFVQRALWLDSIHSTVQAFDYSHTRVQNSASNPEPMHIHEQATCAAILGELRASIPPERWRVWVSIRVQRHTVKEVRREYNATMRARGMPEKCLKSGKTIERWSAATDRFLEQMLADRGALVRNAVR